LGISSNRSFFKLILERGVFVQDEKAIMTSLLSWYNRAEEELTLLEQSLYYILKQRYAHISHDDCSCKREHLVALMMHERELKEQEVRRLEREMSQAERIVDENSRLHKELEYLRPVGNIVEQNSAMQKLLFEQNAELKSLRLKLLQEKTFWQQKFNNERHASHNQVMAFLQKAQWEFLDQHGEALPGNVRDDLIEFMEACRLQVHNM
jgi:hypothetical protein